MRLNQASDFALRILMLLANKQEPSTVESISKELNLVRSHVMKIIAKLTHAGILISQRGRNGGVALGKSIETISIGEVVREIEADFAVVECMKEGKSDCVFAPNCRLKGVMYNARSAFLKTLDDHCLADIIDPQARTLSTNVDAQAH